MNFIFLVPFSFLRDFTNPSLPTEQRNRPSQVGGWYLCLHFLTGLFLFCKANYVFFLFFLNLLEQQGYPDPTNLYAFQQAGGSTLNPLILNNYYTSWYLNKIWFAFFFCSFICTGWCVNGLLSNAVIFGRKFLNWNVHICCVLSNACEYSYKAFAMPDGEGCNDCSCIWWNFTSWSDWYQWTVHTNSQ